MLQLPDNTFVRSLDGVENPPAMEWPRGRPWSPIIGIESRTWPNLGQFDVYVHADGSRTTTLMRPVVRDGVQADEAITLIQHPMPPGPAPTPVLMGPDGQLMVSDPNRPGGGAAPSLGGGRDQSHDR
jgi:hypothetical protein